LATGIARSAPADLTPVGQTARPAATEPPALRTARRVAVPTHALPKSRGSRPSPVASVPFAGKPPGQGTASRPNSSGPGTNIQGRNPTSPARLLALQPKVPSGLCQVGLRLRLRSEPPGRPRSPGHNRPGDLGAESHLDPTSFGHVQSLTGPTKHL